MTDNLELKMDAYQPLRNVVFQTLRTAILKGELKPGERLMELQLASQLGVSRTPIREAIRMLEQEGLAKTIPRKGAEVAGMTAKDMEDVLHVRGALEELAVSTSCQKITDEELAELKDAMDAFIESTKQPDVVQVAQADVTFHDIIYRAADNPKLLSILNNLYEQMYRYRVEYLKDVSIYSRLIEEHRHIYDALVSRDEEAVVSHLRVHLKNQADAVRRIIEKQDEQAAV